VDIPARVDIDFGIGCLPEIRPRKALFMCGKGRHKVQPLLLMRAPETASGASGRKEDGMRKAFFTALVAGMVLVAPASVAGAAGAGGVGGPAFYVDGTLYRTVGTPTDLSGTGAPASSFDTIYEFFGVQTNVATAAPGDPGYNGGRWRVQGLTFTDYAAALTAYDANLSGDFDSEAEVAAAIAGGAATDIGVVKSFVCPVIRLG
jgi:hypothetical protein